MKVTRSDHTGKLDAKHRTPQGGLRVDAYLTRVGVLNYRRSDGSIVRELRHPDEVFSQDSMASLAGAPVTVGHPGKVGPDNYSQHSVGHVGDTVGKAEDRFLSSTLRVQDAKAVSGVESGSLVEISCGYDCDMDPTPGEYNGEKYDAVQRNISYNHVALLPVNAGRAGNDVRLRFDGVDETAGEITSLEVSKLEPDHMDELEKLKVELAAEKTRADKACGERDSLTAQVATLSDPKRMDAIVASTVKLHQDARSILGEKFVAKDERSCMIDALTHCDADFKCDASVSNDYLRGRFDTEVARTAAGAKSLGETRKATEDVITLDATETDLVAEARARNHDRSASAWKAS